MDQQELRERTVEANVRIDEAGLVILSFGNASVADHAGGVYGIKPSGVPYPRLRPEQIVIVRIADGSIVEGTHRPSSEDRKSHV